MLSEWNVSRCLMCDREFIASLRDDIRTKSSSHVQIADVERVVFDELPARLDDVAHQDGEHLVGFDGVVVVQIDLEQLALLRIHRGLNNSLAFISPRPLKRLICTPRRPISMIFCRISGMENSGCDVARSPSPSINSKIGLIARRVVIDLQAFARQFGDDFLDRGRFVQLDQLAAPAIAAVASSTGAVVLAAATPVRISTSKRFRSRLSS